MILQSGVLEQVYVEGTELEHNFGGFTTKSYRKAPDSFSMSACNNSRIFERILMK
jgi:hypothetical protein